METLEAQDSKILFENSKINNRYVIEKKLGSGSCGTAYLVNDLNDTLINKKVLKVYKIEDQDYLQEISILKDLKSMFVIEYFDSFPQLFIDEKTKYLNTGIITEYCSKGDLGQLIINLKNNKSQVLPDEKLFLWCKQMIAGLKFLHSKKIIHRDVKPENIFLTENEDIKLGDLGIAKYEMTKNYTFVGTISYMSPEIIEQDSYTTKIDVWSLGCVIYELIKLEKLFGGRTQFEIMNKIVVQEIVLPEIENKLIERILKLCLIRNVDKRMTSSLLNDEINGLALKKETSNLSLKKSNLESTKCIRTISNAHKENVTCLEILSTNEIVSGSWDKKIRIWNYENGDCLKSLEGHTGYITSLKILSTDDIVSGSMDNTIKIWRKNEDKCLKTLTGHEHGVLCLEVLPTDEIVSGSWDYSIRIWNKDTGNCLRKLEGHTDGIQCLKSLSTSEIISGSNDRTIRLWDLNDGKCLKLFEGHNGSVTCLDGLTTDLIVSGSNDETIRVWNKKSGESIFIIKNKDMLVCIKKISENYFATGSFDKSIKFWEINSGKCIKELKGHYEAVSCLNLLNTGELVSASLDHSIKIWNYRD